jgi:hypothetical protein
VGISADISSLKEILKLNVPRYIKTFKKKGLPSRLRVNYGSIIVQLDFNRLIL